MPILVIEQVHQIVPFYFVGSGVLRGMCRVAHSVISLVAGVYVLAHDMAELVFD